MPDALSSGSFLQTKKHVCVLLTFSLLECSEQFFKAENFQESKLMMDEKVQKSTKITFYQKN